MSKELSKEALVRMAWVTELRRQGHRKCIGAVFYDNKVCALGLLAEVVGISWSLSSPPYKELSKISGLSSDQIVEIFIKNDSHTLNDSHSQNSFAQIADVIESWFPK